MIGTKIAKSYFRAISSLSWLFDWQSCPAHKGPTAQLAEIVNFCNHKGPTANLGRANITTIKTLQPS